EAALRVARESVQSWLIQDVIDVKANVDYFRHGFASVSAWAEQCDPGRILVSRAMPVYYRYIAATQPKESVIRTINACLDSLAGQELALKQIALALILAQLYVQLEQPEEAERHVANAIMLAFQEGIIQPFVAQGAWLREILEDLRVIAPHFIDRI